MKKVFIIANWKSNKTESKVKDWIAEISKIIHSINSGQEYPASQRGEQRSNIDNKEIIICPSFVSLSIVKSSIWVNHLPIKLGAQNISPFDTGEYTGEVNGEQIKEFADYVIVGHSERRINFNETDEIITQKISLAEKYELIPILCVSSLEQIHNSKFILNLADQNSNLIVVYEPLFAIGSGNPDTPENADKIAQQIKSEFKNTSVLYGGSVTSKNVKNFTQMPNIDGVLVGKASLDPIDFLGIIENA